MSAMAIARHRATYGATLPAGAAAGERILCCSNSTDYERRELAKVGGRHADKRERKGVFRDSPDAAGKANTIFCLVRGIQS